MKNIKTNNFRLTHEYDIGDRSIYFTFDESKSVYKAVELAVYLQFKAENVFDDSIGIDHEPMMKYLKLFGAKELETVPDEFNTIDMYFDREKRVGDWYFTKYVEMDEALSKQTVEFLRANANQYGFKNDLNVCIEYFLKESGIQEILSSNSNYVDIAINRPNEFWYNTNINNKDAPKWVKVDSEYITFKNLLEFARYFAKYNDLEISENTLFNGVIPRGLECQVIIPPSVEDNTVSVFIANRDKKIESLDNSNIAN
jgi:Type IV secretory pathway, VirB11 components, and related ATPases involved in archaeal flagella biosynthesis